MTDFASFARSHGLIVHHVKADGRVHRCRTEAKPYRKNGAYAFDGVKGFVQDWTIHPEAISYRGESSTPVRNAPERSRNDAKEREAARCLARDIVRRSALQTHPYLAAKGFPKELGLVDPDDGRLIVPMYAAEQYGEVVSVQRITDAGEKKFLPGGRAKEAVFHLGRGTPDVLVEGYATGLSVRAALLSMYRRMRVVVCFSAGNLAAVARRYQGFVVADNDVSGAGEQAARKSGLPYVMPSEVGTDANDLMMRGGVRAVCALLDGTPGRD